MQSCLYLYLLFEYIDMLYFPDYTSLYSVSRTSQRMHNKEEKKPYISHTGV